MKSNDSVLEHCLFFTANRLSNIMRKIADEAFAELGITSTYVYVLVIVNQYHGISQTELSEKLDISASTCTRFVNKLVEQDILKKEQHWKTSHVYLTKKGKYICERIDGCFEKLHETYREILGKDDGDNLANKLWDVSERLTKKGY